MTITAAASAKLGNAQDVSNMFTGNITLSLSDQVTSKVQPYLDKADSIAATINNDAVKLGSYLNMQSLLSSFQASAAGLTYETLTGSGALSSRSASLSSSLASGAASGSSPRSASNILSASVLSNSSLSTHTVIVNSLAEAEVDVGSTLAHSSTTALGYSGSFKIGENGGSTGTVSVTSAMSMTDIADAINAAKVGVNATVVAVDSTHSTIVLSGADTGKPLSLTDVSGNILQTLGVLNSGAVTGDTWSSESSALGISGSFSVNGSSTVSITTGMSLSDIADAINTTASSSVTASVTGSGSSYQLSITSVDGTPVTFSNDSGVLPDLGLAASGAANQATAPSLANLTVDGVTGVTRNSNTVSDVLTGITLNLTQADPNTKVTIGIVPDQNAAASAIQDFVTSYNNWNAFVRQNEATNNDGTASANAVLFGDATLREASTKISSILSSKINDQTLTGMGISLDNNYDLQINSTTLSHYLSQSFSSVSQLFDNTVTTSSSSFLFRYPDRSSYSGDFTLGITTTSGTISGVTVNGVSDGGFTFSGNQVFGKYGSPYYGMSFTYTGTIGETVTVSATRGMADQVYDAANSYANSSTGSLSINNQFGVTNTIIEKSKRLTDEYNTQITKANSYTDFLLQEYARLSSKIQQAGITTYVLQQIMAAQNSGR